MSSDKNKKLEESSFVEKIGFIDKETGITVIPRWLDDLLDKDDTDWENIEMR